VSSTPNEGFQQLYLPSEGLHAEDFFALKNQTALARFEVSCKVYHLPAQHVMKALK
jgi:hypothetical protein